MLGVLKNRVKVSGFFWRFRHLIHSDVWLKYFESYTLGRRHFYSRFVSRELCNTIFEFGCASGPNLKNIEVYTTRATYSCGYDINKSAIEFAKKQFDPKRSVFLTRISESDLREQLFDWGFDAFDLAIYDRVLYLLSDREVFAHFSEYQGLLTTVVIDDFHNSQIKDSEGSYESKDYV